MTPAIREADVFVIGGGPAGLAAAIAARQRGFQVAVADCAVPPQDKACGEGLMPDGLTALANFGVHIGADESCRFRGIRFLDSGRIVDASFPSGVGLGVRRTALHRRMVEAAEAAGVWMQWGTRVEAVSGGSVSLNGRIVRCRWIIGADGENSQVRRWAGLDTRVLDRPRFGFRRHYRVEPWTDYMELYWGTSCEVYVTPVAADAVCVAAMSNNSQFRLRDAIREFPSLEKRLQSGEAITRERGAVSASRKLKSVYRERVALIGDASGSVDAITGEGLCLALQQAAALADALECGDLAHYQERHRRIARRPELMAALLLALADRKSLRGLAMHTFALSPWIFSKLLAVHTGRYPPREVF